MIEVTSSPEHVVRSRGPASRRGGDSGEWVVAASRGPGGDRSGQQSQRAGAAADNAIVRLDHVPDESLTTELQPGERLSWSGRPDVTRLVHDDLVMLPLSLVAALFALGLAAIIVTSTMRGGVSPFGLLVSCWGLLFAALVLYVALGRLLARRHLGRRTIYALTNRRALVIKPKWRSSRQTASVELATAPAVYQRPGRDGHGTVMFGATLYQRAAP